MAEFVRMDGLKETVAALRALPAQFASKNGGPIRRALFKAAKPIRDDAQVRAPFLTGNLRANIYIYRDRDPKRSGATERYFIAVRTKRGRQRQIARGRINNKLGRISRNFRLKGDAWYWHFIEFGTEKMTARPFLRPAFESNKVSAVTIFTDEMRAGVEAAIRRARQAA